MQDIKIARSVKPQKIEKIAKKLGLSENDLIKYGNYKAKVTREPENNNSKAKLILVTAINPTKAGIGKTTVSIGLADAIAKKHKVCLALREPSLGPVFGTKGGATGGGYSQIIPMEDINLHFNGDFHAITSANNLLCSVVDNHIFQGNELNVDPSKVFVRRCLDLNERELREVTLLSGRKERFTITSASEVMAIMCMAKSLADLKERLGSIMVALDKNGKPLYARDFKIVDAMAILLKDALYPNLVQTLAGTPALVHCGPFANIAHGCNSVRATMLATNLANYVITEAGFGADLGAEKFIDFKCRVSGLKPDCVVLVATIKALKLHGGVDEKDLNNENLEAIKAGVGNLLHHKNVIENVYNLPVVVTINKYYTDTLAEINLAKELVGDVTINDVWGKGGDGALELADKVINICKTHKGDLKFAYSLEDTVENKIIDLVTKVYGGKGIKLSDEAKEKIEIINRLGYDKLPIIIAKTQFSLTQDKTIVGCPKDFIIDVQDVEIRSGAGFLVVICGNMLLMPALGKNPAGQNMTIDNDGKIEGLF